MRNRRDVIALVAVLVCSVALALLMRTRAAGDAAQDPRRTTFSTGPAGTRALLFLLDELGLTTTQRLEPFTAPPDEDVRVAALLAPSQPLTPREVSTLLTWVRDGGTLLYAVGGRGLLSDSLQLRVRPFPRGRLSPVERMRWEGVNAELADDSLTRAVADIGGFRAGFTPRSAPLANFSARVLASAQGTPVIIMIPLGAGQVVAFSDAALMSNARLQQGGSALLLARILGAARGTAGAIEFDEYHHGYRASAGPWGALRAFLRTRPGFVALQLTLAGALVLLLAGRRFGAPYPVAPPRRRSPIEHVEALASAYRRANARWTARRLLLEGMQRRLGRRPGAQIREGGGPPPGTESTAAGRRVLEEWERGNEGSLVTLAQAVDDVVMEVRR